MALSTLSQPHGLHSCLCGRKLPACSPCLYPATTRAPGGRVVMNNSTSLNENLTRVTHQESARSRLPIADTVAFEEGVRKGFRNRLPAADTAGYEDGVRSGFRNPAPRTARLTTHREFPRDQALTRESRRTQTLSEVDGARHGSRNPAPWTSKTTNHREPPTAQVLTKEYRKIQRDVCEEPGVIVDSSKAHLTQTRFDQFRISPLSIKALHTVLKYETMTVVQEATFPVILQGRDVMAKARTGTGKTIAFLLPAIELILEESAAGIRNQVYAVIVCPTRELAQQVAVEAKQLLSFHKNFSAQAVYGGTNIRSEQMELRDRPCQILVGTPGRLVDHIQNTPNFSRLLRSVKLFVLDEADRMLDMGFKQSLEEIRRALPSQRQNLLFSATIAKEVHNIARTALKPGYEFIDTVGDDSQDTHDKVKQQCVVVPLKNQLGAVYSILQQHIQEESQYKVLVFCTTARVTGFMYALFQHLSFNCREIHSRKSQSQRNRVSEEFRSSRGGIVLFTSDVSARGVDYPDVTFVVQVGAPTEVEQYVHRLGRTGRAGKGGEGLLVLAPWEEFFFRKLQKFPINEMPAPSVTPEEEKRISSAASRLDEDLKTMAYQSWIGYYNSLRGLDLDKAAIIAYANQYSSSIGFRDPPALSKMVVRKMGLLGVRGLNVY